MQVHELDARETMTTRELVESGMTRSQIAWAVGRGWLVRVRIGHFCLPRLDDATMRAIRVGGRLTCLSELERLGVWVTVASAEPHVHLAPNASRLRDAADSTARFDRATGTRLHWAELTAEPSVARVAVIDALLHALECCPPAHAVASLDSAVRLGLATAGDLRRLAPARHRATVAAVDGSAESGIESLVRFWLRRLGLHVATQVFVPTVGRIDLVVEGWVAVEADGRKFHEGTVAPRDRRRDARAAALGFTPLRFDYSQVVYESSDVVRAILAAVVHHRNVSGSGRSRARRALRRLRAQFS